MLKNSITTYGSVNRFFHWLVFLMVAGMVISGYTMTDRPLSPFKLELYSWHKSFGFTILALTFLRLVWRWVNIVPALPASMPKYQQLAAHGVHYFLYLLLIIIPMSGWLMSSAANFSVTVFKLFTLPHLIAPDKSLRHFFEEIHEVGVVVLIAVVGLHAAVALFHHYVLKDTILIRMLPFTKRS